MSRKPFFLIVMTGLLALGGGVSWSAQQAPGANEPSNELRDAIRKHFQNRLRAELALSDQQMDEILPLMEEMESSKRRSMRERRETAQQLQRGLREGSSDEELQRLLDRMESIEDDQRESERAALARIDEQLSARQRVRLRFFIERFRREFQRRIESMRGPGGAGRRDGSRPPSDRRR